ncbi:MAG: ABC transporter permease [Spirochaetaceae bacterium]|nr:ABC transporter permease [Spirochaetaceae bacterium]
MHFFRRKLLSTLITLFLVSVLTFSIFQMLPGDPATLILGIDAQPSQIEALRATMDLDKNPVVRYTLWATKALQGDLGVSYKYQRPVSELIFSSINITAQLATLSFLISLLIGIPIGILLAKRDKKRVIIPLSMFSQLGMAIPSFCVAIILIEIFSVKLHVLPSLGYIPIGDSLIGNIRSLLLPSLSIATGGAAIIIRFLRSNIISEKNKDYVRTNRSIGLSENQILYTHILRNSLIPVLTIFGILISDVLGGSIIIENVFSLPGIGKLITSSITSRDLPLIQALVMYLSIIVIITNMIVDMLYGVIDPRIRMSGNE